GPAGGRFAGRAQHRPAARQRGGIARRRGTGLAGRVADTRRRPRASPPPRCPRPGLFQPALRPRTPGTGAGRDPPHGSGRAAEMTSRVERIAAGALSAKGRAAPGAIAWSGTFHAIGARLLRAHAAEIGLSPSFTILDREDAADLLDLARHDLGLSMRKTRFP